MRKVIILLAILAVGMTATAQDVKIKRGKVTMSEADYNVLKQKADLYEKTQKVLDETLAAYQKQQQMNDMYRPIVLKDFNDSASYAIGKDIYQSWLQQNPLSFLLQPQRKSSQPRTECWMGWGYASGEGSRRQNGTGDGKVARCR